MVGSPLTRLDGWLGVTIQDRVRLADHPDLEDGSAPTSM